MFNGLAVDPDVAYNACLVLLAIAFVAFLFNAFFTLIQTATAALGPYALETLEEEPRFQKPSGKRLLMRLPLLEQQFLGAGLVCLLTSAIATAKAGFLLVPSLPWLGAVAGTAIIIVLQIIVVETLLRSVALSNPLGFFRFLVGVGVLLSAPVAPVVSMLQRQGAIRIDPEAPTSFSDMHLRLFPSLEGVGGLLDEDAFEMIDSVREFAEMTADAVMTPRTEVVGVERSMPAAEVYDTLRSSEYSRVVVYTGSMDQILGTLLAKEVLLQRPKDPFTLLRPPVFAQENTRLPELLKIIRSKRSHLVVIMDEYGGVSGIVTLHDLFERIVGHIEDIEDDEELWIERGEEGTYRLNGRVELWEINEELGLELDEDIARTIGGYIFHLLGRAPRIGDEIEVESYRFVVEDTRENRIEKILVEPISEKTEAPAEEGEE